MNKFVRGDVVTDGIRTGSVSESFYYMDADDGTLNQPGADMYPVVWDDQTQGYRHGADLRYA